MMMFDCWDDKVLDVKEESCFCRSPNPVPTTRLLILLPAATSSTIRVLNSSKSKIPNVTSLRVSFDLVRTCMRCRKSFPLLFSPWIETFSSELWDFSSNISRAGLKDSESFCSHSKILQRSWLLSMTSWNCLLTLLQMTSWLRSRCTEMKSRISETRSEMWRDSIWDRDYLCWFDWTRKKE